jgi:hypothetical protein
MTPCGGSVNKKTALIEHLEAVKRHNAFRLAYMKERGELVYRNPNEPPPKEQIAIDCNREVI